MRKPFLRTLANGKKCWYVVAKNGKFVRLDPDEETAYRKWHEMLEISREASDPNVTVLALVNHFITEVEGNVSSGRFDQYVHYLSQFSEKFGGRKAADLTKGEVSRWVNGSKTWGQCGKRECLSSITRLYNWAESEHSIKNKMRGIKKPQQKHRTRVISHDEHRRLIEATRASKQNAAQFSNYLIASRCGARPSEIRRVTAENVVEVDGGMLWVFAEHKTDHTGDRRVVYVPPCLAVITRMLIRQHPKGPLFRQENGAAWTRHTTARKLKRLREKLSIDKDAKLYSYRHTFATDAIVNGASLAEVAAMLGHKDTKMVSRVYGHLDSHSRHLLEKSAQAFR